MNPDLIKKLHRLFNDNDVEFHCCSDDELDLGDGQGLLYIDPPYYNTFDKYTSDGFNQNGFVECLEAVTNRANWKVILSNSNDFEGVIAENDRINLPRIMTVSVKDFTNNRKPAKDRVEIIATNL